LKQRDNEFQIIWRFMHNASGYCIFVYSVLGQACWPWMTPRTVGSLTHVHYRASWKKRFGCPRKSWNFFWAIEWEPCIISLYKCHILYYVRMLPLC